MTSVASRTLGSAVPIRRPRVSVISIVLVFSLLAVVLFVALRSPLKDDIAWLLYVARRWMAGQKLYVDLVEVNPPLIVWISAVPLIIARWVHVDAQFVALPTFIAIVLGCGWWATRLLRPRGGLFADPLPVFAAIASVLLILPAADIGQREHLLVAAFLPYLVLFARSLDRFPLPVPFGSNSDPQVGSIIHRPGALVCADVLNRTTGSVAVAVGAGVLAGLGCALKPQYGVVFVVLECLALTRGLRPWRAMPIAAGVTGAGYCGLVLFICPAYLHRAIPMALALYGGTDVSFLALVHKSVLLLVGLAVASALCWLRLRRMPDNSLMLTLLAFAVTSTVVCFVGGKDWYYHRLPAVVGTVLALLLWTATEMSHRERRFGWPLALAVLTLGLFYVSSLQRLAPEAAEAVEPQRTVVDRLETIIRDEHAHSYIAFSEWIALGFPVVNETGVTWASRFDSMWALKGEVWRARFDPKTAQEWPIARWVTHDFIAACPDIAVVDTREAIQYIPFLSAADSAFAQAWTRYHRIVSFDGLVVYKRGQGGCRDGRAAAEAKPPTVGEKAPPDFH